MRIGLDARLAGPGLGVSRLIAALATELPRLGTDVVWFGDPASFPAAAEPAEIVAPPGPGFAGLDAPRGRRLARDLKIDVMHFAANAGWWSAGVTPSVLTVHDVIWARSLRNERTLRQLLGHAYLRVVVPRALRLAAAVVAPSRTAASDIAARYGRRPAVIPNGVGSSWSNAVPEQAGRRPYLVAFAGRDPRKKTGIVLDAWRLVEPDGIGLVMLAGAGLPEAREDEIRALAADRRIELHGYLSEPALANAVAGSLALLYPSEDEGFALPVLEAMAAGVPVITGLAPVTLEVGGEAAMRLDVHDPVESAAAAARALLTDPNLREQLIARGRSRAARFDWQQSVAAYRDLYASILS